MGIKITVFSSIKDRIHPGFYPGVSGPFEDCNLLEPAPLYTFLYKNPYYPAPTTYFDKKIRHLGTSTVAKSALLGAALAPR